MKKYHYKERKFKEDDRVVCIKEYGSNITIKNQSGTIVLLESNMATIRFDHNIKGNSFNGRGCVVPATKDYIRFAENGEVSDPPPMPIKVAGYEVTKVDKEGFNVGCARVTWNTYCEIGKLKPK